MSNHLLMYDSLRCSFLRIKKPPRQPKCAICGPSASIKSMVDSAEASKTARGPSCSIYRPSAATTLPEANQITPEEYEKVRQRNEPHVLLDVRVREQYDLCSLPGSINISLKELKDRVEEVEELSDGSKPVYCMCRRGIASVSATEVLKEILYDHPRIHSVVNVNGGLDEWRRKVDETFPKY
jgi:adenylyltransferase/sulfurtransferase